MIEDRLSYILDALTELDSIARLSTRDFLADKRTIAATESFLRRSLEAVFDIGRHLLAKAGHTDLAQEYKSIAGGFVKLGVIPPDFLTILERMAGYRNRLVHFYHEVTPEELHAIVQSHRDDLRFVVKHVRDYLAKQHQTES